MPEIAIGVGAGLGATGSVVGGVIGGNSAEDAANAQLAGNREAIAAQREFLDKSIAAQERMATKAAGAFTQYTDQARKDLEPFRKAQYQALGQLQGLADPNNPLYQQQRAANTQAIQRQLAAQGLLRSKKQVDLLSNLELGLNSQRQGIIGGIAGNNAAQQVAQLNQGLGSQLGGVYGNLGGQLGSSFMNAGQNIAGLNQASGNALAQSAIARGQATAGIFSGLNNTIQGTMGNYIALDQYNKQNAMLGALLGARR